MYEYVNVNPCKKRLGDCVVRALSLALNQSWYRTAIDLCIEGLIQCDMQDSNSVWGAYLQSKGFKKYPILDTLTFEEFATAHPKGLYVVGTGHTLLLSVTAYFLTTGIHQMNKSHTTL